MLGERLANNSIVALFSLTAMDVLGENLKKTKKTSGISFFFK